MAVTFWECEPDAEVCPTGQVPIQQARLYEPAVMEELARLVLAYEPEIKRQHREAVVGGAERIADSLTSRYYAFNVLIWPGPAVARLRRFIHESYLELIHALPYLRRQHTYIQCWANTVRRGECIHLHNHGGRRSYFSGNVSVDLGGHTGSLTHYALSAEAAAAGRRLSVENEPGQMTLFPSWLYHFTDPWPHDQVRVTMAFDIVLPEVYERQKQRRVVRKYIPFDAPAVGLLSADSTEPHPDGRLVS